MCRCEVAVALVVGTRATGLIDVCVTAMPMLRLTTQKVQRVLILKVEVV